MNAKEIMGKAEVSIFHVETMTEHLFEFYWMKSNGDGEIHGCIMYPNGPVVPGTSGFYRTSNVADAIKVARLLAERHVYSIEQKQPLPRKIGKGYAA